MIETILQGAGIKKLPFIAGFIGAVISLKYISGCEKSWQKMVMAFSGAFAANYCTELVMAWLETGKGEAGIAFAIGLFGMSLAAALMDSIARLDLADVIKGRIGK